jgi:hypothetical protein
MYETKKETPLTRPVFWHRLIQHAALALGVVIFSLIIGMAGYSGFEHMSLLDSFLNTAMLLGGMGPVNPPVTPAGKLFAGIFALYAGLVFIVTAALLFTPLMHRLMHRFHWPEK